MTRRVGCAVLAAGCSRRLGFAKQLSLYDGVPLVERAVDCALHSHASSTLVVLGARAEAVRRVLAGRALEFIENARAAEGLAASVRVAALWAIERELDALLIALCDQPFLTDQHLNSLIAAFERTGLAAASYYGGRCAVPALFPARLVPALLTLRGDKGARDLLRMERPIALVPWPAGELDVDTEAQAERLEIARAPSRCEEPS